MTLLKVRDRKTGNVMEITNRAYQLRRKQFSLLNSDSGVSTEPKKKEDADPAERRKGPGRPPKNSN